MRLLLFLPVVGLALAACSEPRAPTAPQSLPTSARASSHGYTVVDLGDLGGDNGAAYAINDRGQVVGFSTLTVGGSDRHAFLWERGVMTDLGTLGGANSDGWGINDRGQVVGSGQTTDGTWHAFLWDRGVMTDLGTLGGDSSAAHGINNQGQVVGHSATASGEVHAFLWEGGVMTDLGTLGAPNSWARGINDRGQVVGSIIGGPWHAFLWEGGVMTDLGTLGGMGSFARGINERGQVVGGGDASMTSPFDFQALLWEKGVWHGLGMLGGAVTDAEVVSATDAEGINERGQVVGVSFYDNQRAFVWEEGVMTELGTPEGNDSWAYGINNLGQVVGHRRTSWEWRATLWTP